MSNSDVLLKIGTPSELVLFSKKKKKILLKVPGYIVGRQGLENLTLVGHTKGKEIRGQTTSNLLDKNE